MQQMLLGGARHKVMQLHTDNIKGVQGGLEGGVLAFPVSTEITVSYAYIMCYSM